MGRLAALLGIRYRAIRFLQDSGECWVSAAEMAEATGMDLDYLRYLLLRFFREGLVERQEGVSYCERGRCPWVYRLAPGVEL